MRFDLEKWLVCTSGMGFGFGCSSRHLQRLIITPFWFFQPKQPFFFVFFSFFFFCKMIRLSYGRVFRGKVLGVSTVGDTIASAHTEYVRSPIFIFSLLVIPVAHAYTNTYCSMAGPSCCPKAWNTTFVCLRLVFFPWTLLTFILQLKVLEVPPAVGGKLSLDENELQSSLPRHRLVCLYLHYPAIPQLPLFPSWYFFFTVLFSVHITICSSSPLMWLLKLLSLSKVNWLLGEKKVSGKASGLGSLIEH